MKPALSEADEVIEADSIGEKDARLLEIKENSPVLVVKRLTYLGNMRVIEKLIAFYSGDAFKILTDAWRINDVPKNDDIQTKSSDSFEAQGT